MVKYEDSGLAHRRQRSQHRPKRQLEPLNRFRFGFFSVPVPFSTSSSLSQQEKEIKNKLSTDSPCIWATQCWVIERNHSRNLWRSSTLPKMIMKNFGEARVAGRASPVSASLWWDGRLRRTIEACLTFPEWVQGKNRKKTVVATKKKKR